MGMLKKQERNYQEARMLFLQCFEHEDNPEKEVAGIELAKILEHKEKDVSLALFYTEKSLDYYNQRNKGLSKNIPSVISDFEKRMKRLQRKLNK